MAFKFVDLVRDATGALVCAEYALPGDGDDRLLVGILRNDVKRLGEVVEALTEDESQSPVPRRAKTAAVTACLQQIANYALFVASIVDKPGVMHIVMYDHLEDKRIKTYAAVAQARTFIKTLASDNMEPLPSIDQLKASMQSWAFGDEDTQLEALSSIARADTRSAAIDSTKQKLMLMVGDNAKDKVSKLPDWYVTEREFEHIRVVNERSTAFLATHVSSSQRSFFKRIKSDEMSRVSTSSLRFWYNLQHPNICRLVGANHLARPSGCIMTEYCSLGSIDTFLQADDSEEQSQQAIQLLIQVCRALLAMHSAGIVHGNVRSSNVLLTFDKQVKLTGLSECESWQKQQLKLMLAGAVPPEPLAGEASENARWLAPECISRSAVCSPSTDVYGFGLIMYEALTGKAPFEDMDSETVWDAKKQGESQIADLASLYQRLGR